MCYLPPFILEASVKNVVKLVRRESKICKSALGFLAFWRGFSKVGKIRVGEKRRDGGVLETGGGGFFVLREGEVSSDERQVEEILIIVVCIQTEYKTRDGSE